jgi:SAM-dependent methyltransferase
MTDRVYTTRLTCRACGYELQDILSLGDIYLNDFVDEGKEIVSAPLTLTRCTDCNLVQLRDTPDLDRLYRQYWYQSSLNKSMVKALQDVVDSIESKIYLRAGDVVMDIGCNDGTMLSQYRTEGLYKIGFDPALNLAEKAKQHCDEFYNTYFGDTAIETPKAKVVTSIAMFYDLEDPHTFIELVKRSMTEDGIWVVQFTDLFSMFMTNAFDTICHEHLEYYSFAVLYGLMADHGLEVFDVSMNNVNGGSIRAYVAHRGQREIMRSVMDQLVIEETYMDQYEDPFVAFANRIDKIKEDISKFLADARTNNKTVFALGASTKGNTLLQYFGISNEEIPFAAEVNPAKFGKKTVGTNISIISEEEALKKNPDFFLVLPWHFINMLREVHASYLKKGGKLVVPLPEPKVYENEENLTSKP